MIKLPVIDIMCHTDFAKRNHSKFFRKKVQVSQIVGLSREVDPEWPYCQELRQSIKKLGWREEKGLRIELYEYEGFFYVYNGNHRCSILVAYLEELKVTSINADVYLFDRSPLIAPLMKEFKLTGQSYA